MRTTSEKKQASAEDPSSYAALAQKAEASVSSVSDPELKKIAFARILDALLGGTPAVANQKPTRNRSRVADPKANKRLGPQAHIEDLVSEGFFRERRTIAEVKLALGNRGYHIPVTSLSGPLQSMCKRKQLRREKAKLGENKQGFAYSNW